MATEAQYLSEPELNIVKGIIHYLNTNVTPGGEDGVAVEAKLIDINGESLGLIMWNTQAASYVLYPGLR